MRTRSTLFWSSIPQVSTTRARNVGLLCMLVSACAASPSLGVDPVPPPAQEAPAEGEPGQPEPAEPEPTPESPPPVANDGGRASDEVSARRAALRALIMGIATPTAVSAQAPSEVLPAREETDVHGDTMVQCTYRRYTGTQVFDSLVSFDPNADALWPGSVVQSRNLSDGQLAPIGLARAAGTVTISNAILGGDTGYSRVVASPSQASVQAAIADILSAKKVNLAAKADFVAEQVHSLSEAALKVGISADWMTASVKGSFDANWRTERTSFIVRFTQSYYTASFSPPPNPEGVFGDSVTVDDASPYMGPRNPPTYIGSVTYGRTLFVKIDSDESESDVKAAIEATFQAGVADVSGSLSARHRDVMGRASVTVFALGGSPDDAVEIMTAGADRAAKLKAYFDRGANYSASSPGVPISYTVRNLRDNSAMKVASNLDYSVPECAPSPAQVRINIGGFDIVDNNTWIGSTTVGYKVWINGNLEIQGQRSGIEDGSYINVGEQRVLTVDRKNGQKIHIRAEVSESDRAVTPERTHTFFIDTATKTGTFTQLGYNSMDQGSGSLKAGFWYSIHVN